MHISTIRQNISAQNVQSGKSSPHHTGNNQISSDGNVASSSKTIDMRSVSVNEINQLIKAGVDGLLDVVPVIPPDIINEYGSEYAANIKVDFLGQVESMIEFNKSINEPTEFLENVLANLKSIDGMELPSKISVLA